jgi:hypothetical protein
MHFPHTLMFLASHLECLFVTLSALLAAVRCFRLHGIDARVGICACSRSYVLGCNVAHSWEGMRTSSNREEGVCAALGVMHGRI